MSRRNKYDISLEFDKRTVKSIKQLFAYTEEGLQSIDKNFRQLELTNPFVRIAENAYNGKSIVQRLNVEARTLMETLEGKWYNGGLFTQILRHVNIVREDIQSLLDKIFLLSKEFKSVNEQYVGIPATVIVAPALQNMPIPMQTPSVVSNNDNMELEDLLRRILTENSSKKSSDPLDSMKPALQGLSTGVDLLTIASIMATGSRGGVYGLAAAALVATVVAGVGLYTHHKNKERTTPKTRNEELYQPMSYPSDINIEWDKIKEMQEYRKSVANAIPEFELLEKEYFEIEKMDGDLAVAAQTSLLDRVKKYKFGDFELEVTNFDSIPGIAEKLKKHNEDMLKTQQVWINALHQEYYTDPNDYDSNYLQAYFTEVDIITSGFEGDIDESIKHFDTLSEEMKIEVLNINSNLKSLNESMSRVPEHMKLNFGLNEMDGIHSTSTTGLPITFGTFPNGMLDLGKIISDTNSLCLLSTVASVAEQEPDNITYNSTFSPNITIYGVESAVVDQVRHGISLSFGEFNRMQYEADKHRRRVGCR